MKLKSSDLISLEAGGPLTAVIGEEVIVGVVSEDVLLVRPAPPHKALLSPRRLLHLPPGLQPRAQQLHVRHLLLLHRQDVNTIFYQQSINISFFDL